MEKKPLKNTQKHQKILKKTSPKNHSPSQKNTKKTRKKLTVIGKTTAMINYLVGSLLVRFKSSSSNYKLPINPGLLFKKKNSLLRKLTMRYSACKNKK
jgi:hypothetical protein